MGWTELTSLRNRRSRTYRNDADPSQRRWSGTLAALHYESELGSDICDAEIDATPQRVDVPSFDGWRVTANGWHYALGRDLANHGDQDGWIGFGGRQGAHWFKFRLARVGYLHWPTRAWDDVGGTPTYDRANLSQEARTLTIGPNDDAVTVEGVATWAGLWTTPGGGDVSASWAVRGDQLKEEIRVNQAAREWIANNRPPGTPLNETWFGFVFRLDWSDVPCIYRGGMLTSADNDFADDGETVELRDALDRLLAFLPLDFVHVADAPRGTDSRVVLRKRFYKDGDDHYLLVGVRCDALNGLPGGDLAFDPTVNEQVGADADDAYEWEGDGQVYGIPANNDTKDYAGCDETGGDRNWPGARFQTVAVPADATITTATFSVCAFGSVNPTDCEFKVYADDVDDAGAWAADDSPRDITKTDATVDWDPVAWTLGEWYSPPDVKAIVQEIVDRGGWASGQDLRLAVFPDVDVVAYVYWYDFLGDNSKAAKLDITYKTTVSDSVTADATIKRAGLSGSVTADATLKRVGLSGSVTADATVKRVGLSASITADAAVKKAATDTITADATLKRVGLSGSVTADATLKRAGLSDTIAADATVKRAGLSGSVTADATLKKAQADSITADATLKRAGLSGSVTADAAVKRAGLSGSVTADAVLKKAATDTVTADATLKRVGLSGSITADAALKHAQSGSIKADAALKQAGVSGAITADAALKHAQAGSVTADAALKAAQSGSVTADAALKRTGLGDTITADAVVKKVAAASITADAALKRTGLTGTVTADAALKRTGVSGTVTADAALRRAQTGSVAADAALKRTGLSGSVLVDAALKRLALTGAITADAAVKRTGFGGSITADAILARTQTGSITADATLFRSGLSGTVTADAAVKQAGLLGTVTADAVLKRTGFGGSVTADATIVAIVYSACDAPRSAVLLQPDGRVADVPVPGTRAGEGLVPTIADAKEL